MLIKDAYIQLGSYPARGLGACTFCTIFNDLNSALLKNDILDLEDGIIINFQPTKITNLKHNGHSNSGNILFAIQRTVVGSKTQVRSGKGAINIWG